MLFWQPGYHLCVTFAWSADLNSSQRVRTVNWFYYRIGEKATSQWVHSPRRSNLKMSHAPNFNVKENDFYSLCLESGSHYSKVMKSSQLIVGSLVIDMTSLSKHCFNVGWFILKSTVYRPRMEPFRHFVASMLLNSNLWKTQKMNILLA